MIEAVFDSKYSAIRYIFDIENTQSRWTQHKVSFEKFLSVISNNIYNLKRDLNIQAQGVQNLLKQVCPERPGSTQQICTYLLQKYGLKYCTRCCKVYWLEDFHTDQKNFTGKNTYCKQCFNDIVRDTRKEYEASRRAKKLLRTPQWANLEKIKEIYNKCPIGMQVDHIIPLQGKLVQGLHVENNLQYLSADENLLKQNNYTPA